MLCEVFTSIFSNSCLNKSGKEWGEGGLVGERIFRFSYIRCRRLSEQLEMCFALFPPEYFLQNFFILVLAT